MLGAIGAIVALIGLAGPIRQNRSVKIRAIGSALLAAACSSPTPSPPTRPGSAAEPPVAWDQRVDFTEFRTAFGDREDFADLCERGRPLAKLFSSANSADWTTVLALSDDWLSSCPVDIDAHYVRAIALAETGRQVESLEHVRWYRGLVDSILASGDGETPETPYVVISIAEEYSVLRALGLERKSQSLLDGGIDALAAEDEHGEATTIYFWPESHWRRLARELGELE